MEVCRKSSWLFLLLGLICLAVTLQGVQGGVESEGPSESECRPYIEKALKELETADSKSPGDLEGDSKEDVPTVEITTDDSDHEEDDGDNDDEVEGTDSTETVEEEEADESEEKEVEDNEQSTEQAEEELNPETEKVESEEEIDKIEEQTEGEEAEEEKEDDETEEEKEDEEDEAEEEVKEEEEEDEEEAEGKKSEETEGEKSEETEDEKSEETAAVSEEETEGEEAEAKEEEEEGQAETEAEEEEEAEEVEEADEDEQPVESKAESQEEEEISAEKAESEEATPVETESAEDEQETEKTSAEEEIKETEKVKRSDDETQSAEAVESPEEKEVSDKESAEDESAVEGEQSVEDATSVEDTRDVEESKEGVNDDKRDESVEDEAAEESKEEERSKEDDASTKPDSKEADATSKEDETTDQEGDEESKEAIKEEIKESVEEQKDDDKDEEKSTSKEEKEEERESVEEAAEDNQEGGESEEASEESAPEEELIDKDDVPTELRHTDHLDQLLKLDEENLETEKITNNVAEITLRELKKIYENAIKPLEVLYKYRDLSNRHFGDAEIFSKPLVVFMGPWSGGKSSIINYLIDNEYNDTSLRTGAEPSPAYFNILMYGEEPEVLDGTQLAADFTFSGLQKFGQGLEERLRGLKLPKKLLEKMNLIEIPGILEVRKQVSRVFPFNDACQWFIDRADIIFLVYDPSKLDVGPETEAILDQLKGREHQTRIILNKADQVKPEELMRVQGALIWNISPLMSSAQPPVMYTTSLWSRPYEPWAPVRLLQAQERAFLRDLRSAIDKRIENKIASARRFAVRVRNHAKMVDCYLTTYYNHKSVFGNRKQVSDAIIEHPQDYHIYEGLSTLTNISRYDLPDPDVYRDFFRLNPLYDFQQLSATCTYFRGCPINRLDVAIAYDLPELVGKHKRMLEAALAVVSQSQTPGS